MLPDSVLVISVMKEEFSKDEKVYLKDLVEWSRKSGSYKPKHWIILLTGVEIFAHLSISEVWKKRGGPYKSFSKSYHTDSFSAMSDATIKIHLDMPKFSGKK